MHSLRGSKLANKQKTIIRPSKLTGTVTTPSSKSAAHRAVICAALACGTSVIENIGQNDDITATISAVKSFGAECVVKNDTLTITGIGNIRKDLIKKSTECFCNESGSTLRFLAPIASALGLSTTFTGSGRLPERPMDALLDAMKENGVTVSYPENTMFKLSGQLISGTYNIRGDISSQYISGLLFALPLLNGTSEIHIEGNLESARYIDMTIDMMSKFGVNVKKTNLGYIVVGNQNYQSRNITVEGDYSGAAFWLSAAAIGHNILIKGLEANSLQADKDILSVLKNFGAKINILSNGDIEISGGDLKATKIDASGIPDSIPILAVVAAFAEGETVIYNAERLRIKESDRLESTTVGLSKMGVNIKETTDGLIIKGGIPSKQAEVDSYNDHRIAMAMSIAALGSTQSTTILDSRCVEKSYPEFYTDLKLLGGDIDVIDMGK